MKLFLHKYKLYRLVKYKIYIPIARSKHDRKVLSRGVFVGFFIAFTPTVGFQIPLLISIWLCFKVIFKFNFSLSIAIALSWISNPFTAAPLYYIYYLTGVLITNEPSPSITIESIKKILNNSQDNNYYNSLILIYNMTIEFGTILLIGCMPFAILFGVAGYFLVKKNNL
jgi:uncharacterized protein